MIAKLVALVVPLGLDTFAVAATLGMTGIPAARRLRLSLLFAGFEAGMPLLGLALGAPLRHVLGDGADYLAIAVLLAFGLYTLLDSDDDQQIDRLTQLGGLSAIVLAITISVDELAIGLTLGLLQLPTALIIGLIALQAFALTWLGLHIGDRLSDRFCEGAERLAGAALTGLGLVLLAEKTLG